MFLGTESDNKQAGDNNENNEIKDNDGEYQNEQAKENMKIMGISWTNDLKEAVNFEGAMRMTNLVIAVIPVMIPISLVSSSAFLFIC